jgi:hypothetical protein
MKSTILSLRAILSLLLVGFFISSTLAPFVTADAADAAWDAIKSKMNDIICSLKKAFATTATGVAAFVMVVAGVQWVSSESDPGARKKARTAIIHAVVGLLIVQLASDIAGLVLPYSCP